MPTANDYIAKLLGTEDLVTEKILTFSDSGLKFPSALKFQLQATINAFTNPILYFRNITG